MTTYEKEISIYGIIDELHKVEAESIVYREKKQLFKRAYSNKYNGYTVVQDFKQNLEKLVRDFGHELQNLPIICPSESGRTTYLKNLYHNVVQIRKDIAGLYEEVIQPTFKVIYEDHDLVFNKFPEYDPKKHRSRLFYENQKVHFMYRLHYVAVSRAMEIVVFYGNNEGIDLTKTKKALNKKTEKLKLKKAITPLSVSQISYLINLLNDVAFDRQMTKTELAMYISENIGTVKTENPSKRQVYKSLFEADANTHLVVKEVVIGMLNKINEQ